MRERKGVLWILSVFILLYSLLAPFAIVLLRFSALSERFSSFFTQAAAFCRCVLDACAVFPAIPFVANANFHEIETFPFRKKVIR